MKNTRINNALQIFLTLTFYFFFCCIIFYNFINKSLYYFILQINLKNDIYCYWSKICQELVLLLRSSVCVIICITVNCTVRYGCQYTRIISSHSELITINNRIERSLKLLCEVTRAVNSVSSILFRQYHHLVKRSKNCFAARNYFS